MHTSLINPEQAVTCLSALAQSSRLKIFRLLVVAGDEGCRVGDIGKRLELPAATLSFHLKELSHSRLIEKRNRIGGLVAVALTINLVFENVYGISNNYKYECLKKFNNN